MTSGIEYDFLLSAAMANCPICEGEVRKVEEHGERIYIECLRCGAYSVSRSALQDLPYHLQKNKDNRNLLSYALYRMTKGRSDWPMLTSDQVDNILKNTVLPLPKEQLDNLIVWMGSTQSGPSDAIRISAQTIAATGALDRNGVGFLLDYAVEKGLVSAMIERSVDGFYAIGPCHLTFTGWEYFYELQRGNTSSRRAFMAMKFGDPETDSLFRDHFKVAVKAAGFHLRRLDEEPRAGLIDDRLRVEIRQSRFLIADLTHANPGAYWEAGFAEGLDKPVIFTCRRDIFDGPKTRPHFDTNHHLTVVWDPANLDEAVEQLKATIRATLPEEAKLND